MTRLLYPTTNLKVLEQLVIARGAGVYVWDRHGKQYLEGMAGLWCTALGYGNEELIEAASAQMRQLAYSHLFGGKSHPAAIDLAERLAAMVPVKDAHVFFGLSGSDANDTHWKLLRYYFNANGQPARRKIIVRERAYHGVTVASAAMTGLPSNHAHFDLPFEALGIIRTDATHFYRQCLPGESETDFATRLAANLEQLILREGPETIAAFLAEPVSGAGGVVMPPNTYWEKVQSVLRRYNILLIADEVITGFGRTGHDFGATTYAIQPDMMTVAKALSSAYVPISAAIVRGDIYEALVEPSAKVGMFGHGYTYSGHPVGCAVALKALEIYARERTFEHAARVGEYFQRRLRTLADHPLVGEVRGVGLLAAVELVADKRARTAFAGGRVGIFAQNCALEHRLILRAVAGSSLAICPPLIITEAQVDELVDKLGRALDGTLAFVDQEGLRTAA
ncbi:MAG: aminotransferase class III-fold pyridoxal phosphate-dependent enzyme [Opitutus sp.]|nr:aminotransferase class III-fold pyridoxal phosphate-dependent enzyme [Opitutus sp.]